MQALLLFLGLCLAVRGQQLSNCDPLDPSRCGLPFPNNFWLRYNATVGTSRLALAPETFPSPVLGQHIDPDEGGWNELDGFSPLSPCTTYFANLSLANVPPYWNISLSLLADSPTVLLDTVTGERVAHFGELDHGSGSDPTEVEMLFMVWPASRLVSGRRYIVAMRDLLTTAGQPVPSSWAFTALRDNITTNNTDVEARRALFEDIFAQLGASGVKRNTLQLAWDFTVMSRETITDRFLFMREDAFARTAPGISYRIDHIYENFSDYCTRRVEGSMYLPQYVNSQLPGAHLVINSTTQLPIYQGMAWVPFTLLVPWSLVTSSNGTATGAGIPLHYGHGLFGERTEVLTDYLQQQALQHGYLFMATDWIGLSKEDELVVGAMLATDLTQFRMVPDRVSQGMLHALLMMRLIRQGKFLMDRRMLIGGQPVAQPNAPAFYYGNSDGGILGTIYMATTTDVLRGTLGVGGASYGLLLPRSKDFADFWTIVKFKYANSIDRIHLLDFIQLLWNRMDPAGYLDAIVSDPLPGTPTHAVLLQHGLGDAQVSYVAAYAWGRSLGAVMFESNVCEPNEALWGFPFIPDDSLGSTAVQVTWQFPGVPPVPEYNIPPTGQDTHEYPRRQQDAQDMMYGFFTTGFVKNTCGGPCMGEIPPT